MNAVMIRPPALPSLPNAMHYQCTARKNSTAGLDQGLDLETCEKINTCATATCPVLAPPQIEIDHLLLGERSGFFEAVKLGLNPRLLMAW